MARHFMRFLAIRFPHLVFSAVLLAAAGFCLCLALALRPAHSPPLAGTAAPAAVATSAVDPARQAAPESKAKIANRSYIPAPLRRAHLPGPIAVEVMRVIDGDTFEGRLRVWFGLEITTLIRLRNIDAPERKARCAAEAQLAVEASQTLEDILHSGAIILSDISLDKYAGRVLADVAVMSHDRAMDDVGQLLLAGGYARAYQGRRRAGWCS